MNSINPKNRIVKCNNCTMKCITLYALLDFSTQSNLFNASVAVAVPPTGDLGFTFASSFEL